MNPVEKTVIQQLKQLLLERVGPHRLILFGSRARGDAHPQSDMDVAVILKGDASATARELVSDCAWEAGWERGIVVVPMVFTEDEWEHGSERESIFVQAIRAEGVPV